MATITSSFHCQQIEEAFIFQETDPLIFRIKALLVRLRLFDCHHVTITNHTITVDQSELDLPDNAPFTAFPQISVEIEKRVPQSLPHFPLSLWRTITSKLNKSDYLNFARANSMTYALTQDASSWTNVHISQNVSEAHLRRLLYAHGTHVQSLRLPSYLEYWESDSAICLMSDLKRYCPNLRNLTLSSAWFPDDWELGFTNILPRSLRYLCFIDSKPPEGVCKSLPDSLSHLRFHRIAFLDGNAEELAKKLPLLGSLTHLAIDDYLSDREDTLEAKGAASIISCVPHTLTFLSLIGGYMRDEGVRAITQNLPRVTSLTHLNLKGNLISTRGMEELSNALPPTLTYLNVGHNNIFNPATLPLSQALRALPKLVYFNFCRNNITDDGVERLVAACPATLTYLNVGNNFSGGSATEVAKHLPRFEHLTHLKLDNAAMGEAEGPVVVETLPSLRFLTHLDFRSNQEISGIEALTKILSRLSSLSYLNLNDCNITDKEMVPLAQTLPALPFLRYLDLGHNMFDDAGGYALADVLPQLTQLRELPFYFEDIFSRKVIHALKSNAPIDCNLTFPSPFHCEDEASS